MICHRVEMGEAAVAAVDKSANREAIGAALARLARFKQGLAAPEPFSEERFEEINRAIWELRVAVLGEEGAKQRSAEDGKRSPVELY